MTIIIARINDSVLFIKRTSLIFSGISRDFIDFDKKKTKNAVRGGSPAKP